MSREKQVVQCHRSERIISRQGIQHRCREVIFGEESSYGVTLCHKHIEIPPMGEIPGDKGKLQDMLREMTPQDDVIAPLKWKVGRKSILDQVKEWESTFRALYKRKPRTIEREQYFIGRIHALQSLREVSNAK